ncbi:TPA: DUF4214 domain-containing protein [Pseudomonas aeruginosa]|nr:DUF4214 domain-containing protein [Pseudomonas aeruginosa]HBO8065517.1 DUF4214 domain-containing protein [Pseudomonas aeruginosa]HBO8072122.1 DUF4214 domain-containing protein [Pseudomonas aeruginosa]HBO8085887.1 DUF4214 domain-containing protein [Pseudomonas aeruginosa]HBO8092063.1 DUF4214 domain-containing protein [Pseudomonas aeruginosa]
MATTSAQVQQLYVAYLGRAADKGGLDYWLGELNSTPAKITLDQIRANFVNEQPEYAAAYGGLNRTEIVSKIYLNLFGRPADAGGLAYWTTGGGASVSADQLLVAFINGASATDAQTVANKVLVSEVYTSTAGANYASADATAVLEDVDNTAASVTAALGKLSDGSLAGIAIPAGVATVKALAAAEAAQTAYESSKVASLKALNDKVVALDAGYNSGLTDITDGTDDAGSVAGDSYGEVAVAITNATTLRDAIAGGSTVTTAQVELDAKQAADKLSAEYAKLVNVSATAAKDVATYNAAVTANAALTAPSSDKVDNDTAALQGVIGASAANGTAFTAAATAYTTAGGTATITTADQLFTALSNADATELARLDAAFNTGVFTTGYAAVRADGVAQAAKNAAQKAEDDAAAQITKSSATYVNLSEASADAAKKLADVKAADALVAEATAETNAHDAVVKVVSDAQDAVNAITAPTANAFAQNVDTATGTTTVGTAKADLFYFTNTPHTNDFSIGGAAANANFAKGDAIYLGEGYTFNSGALSTGDNNVKEVFFVQGTAGVQVVIESTVAGSTNTTTNATTGAVTTTGGATDTTTVITLTGVTDVAQLSFANGVVTHV